MTALSTDPAHVPVTIHRVGVLIDHARQTVRFGFTTSHDATPVILKRAQITHAGSFDDLFDAPAIVTVDASNTITHLEVPTHELV